MPKSDQAPSSSLIREGMKRAIATGTAAIFMTEEGVRTLLGELKLPKDIVRYVTEQAAEGRQEFFDMLRKEIRRFFDRYDMGDELRKLFRENQLEINARLRLIPNDEGGVTPEVLSSSVKQTGSGARPSRKKKKKTKKKSAKKKKAKKKAARKKSKSKKSKKKR